MGDNYASFPTHPIEDLEYQTPDHQDIIHIFYYSGY